MSRNLWLDDVRDPALHGAVGWVWAKTVPDAQAILATGDVDRASLDHDLGACDVCLAGKSEADWLIEHDYQQMPNCSHVGTGYDLVCWMEATGHWPKQKPAVHSANPVGAARMRQAIEREAMRRGGTWEASA